VSELLPFEVRPQRDAPPALPAAQGPGLSYVGPFGPMFFAQEPDRSSRLHGPLRVDLPADARAVLDQLYGEEGLALNGALDGLLVRADNGRGRASRRVRVWRDDELLATMSGRRFRRPLLERGDGRVLAELPRAYGRGGLALDADVRDATLVVVLMATGTHLRLESPDPVGPFALR
jgi:hypothetical protein